MAEDSAELMKTLEENRRTLQKQIGCLAGLLQIFDRHRCSFTGRRFGSHRTNTTAHEDAASTACGTDVMFHDLGSPLQTYHKYSEVPIQSSSGNEERGLPLDKEESVHSRLSSDFVSPQELKSPPRTAPAAHRRTSLDATTRPSSDNFCRSPDSGLIRTIVVNSLHKERPRSSVDNSNREVMAGLIRLKNLARSRSVGGRSGSCGRTSVEFPRSSSLSAQQSSRIYDAPNLMTHRLTVELEEGPGVGTKKLQRMSASNCCERDGARQAVLNLDKALGEVDLKESFRALQREKSTHMRSDVECTVGERSAQDGRRSVVARLMGLEEFSSLPCKDHGMKARGRSVSPKHRLMDGMPSPLRQGKLMKLQEGGGKTLEPFHGGRLQQLRSRYAAEERATLNQIMETLQLKGLLHSPQRKSRSATPEYAKQRSKDPVASDQACHNMKHKETDTVKQAPVLRDHHVECKSSRSQRSDATAGARYSNEDGGSATPGRGRSRSPVKASKSPVRSASRSPVRASKSPVRLNNDARLASQASGTTLPSTKPVRPFPSHLKLQVVPGQETNAPHLRDGRESKVAPVAGKLGTLHSHDPVSNGVVRNCDFAQTVKLSPEMRRQKRITGRELQSGAPRSLSLGQEHEEKSSETTEKPSEEEEEEENAIQTSTNQDSCVDLNTSPANIREVILETLKDLQMPLKDAKESSEMTTPRAGFQVEKISPALEKSGQCSEGSCEQRSPVSVLDNSIFDEDGSPSPIPTDSYESNVQCDEVMRPENATAFEETESDHTSSCDHGREFVEELLKRSGSANHANLASRVEHSEINPTLLMDLKEDLQRMPFLEQGAHLNALHPQALMDYVYELVALKVAEHESIPWKRHNLVDAIWKELQEIPSAASGDICDAVQGILIEDVVSRGPKWTDFGAEIGEVGVEVERMIYRDLMEEVVSDLTCSGSSRYLAKLLEGPRRQLFAS